MELETVIFLHPCKQEDPSNSELLGDGVGLSWSSCWMMVLYSLVCTQQLLVEVELVSFVLIHSQGQL